jgi:hypothetical protein
MEAIQPGRRNVRVMSSQSFAGAVIDREGQTEGDELEIDH